MATDPGTPATAFTLDVTGRYVCNGLDEALASTDRGQNPDARPFDFIILGGGTFGAVLASHLFQRDATHSHRILVLEAGPMVFPEHVQNQPLLSTEEVWGVPWNADSPEPRDQRFPGLAYCVGGRSLFWGGWSPYFIDSEILSPPWPPGVRRDLTEPVLTVGGRQVSYLDDSARQIGADRTSDFLSGALHEAMRERLFRALRLRPPDPRMSLLGSRGTPMSARRPASELKRELEAPLGVQSSSPRAGFFPFNKFSATQLLILGARAAALEAIRSGTGSVQQRDVFKRLMLVDRAHVIRLERSGGRVTAVHTNQGTIGVPERGKVFIALGTLESTRLALATLPDNARIGRNLMAHLRSNLTFRVSRSSFGAALERMTDPSLQVSALFVKGVHRGDGGRRGHFHVQITASATGRLGIDSEAQLFKKIPDIDMLDRFDQLDGEWTVVTLRGIGEMEGDRASGGPDTGRSRVVLDRLGPQGDYDYGQPRALVRLAATADDLALWEAMDRACEDLARMIAGGGPVQYLAGSAWQDAPPDRRARRDPLSSTHHEGGTLWMGPDPATSVTDERGRFHETENLYALGPALLPTLGSPNPMLSGVALARRTGDHLVPFLQPAPVEPGFTPLFDGTSRTWNLWQAVGKGAFALVDGAIVAQPGEDLGLLYFAPQSFGDFTLRLQFRLDQQSDNSGVFVRSRDPKRPVPDRNDPSKAYPYDNQAYVPVHTGFEVQIDELARGTPDGLDQHRTGAIYAIPIGTADGQQDYQRGPALQPGEWNDYEITVSGDVYRVRLNGQETVKRFKNTDPYLGKSPSEDPFSGYIGLQSHTGHVAFRNIRITSPVPIEEAAPVPFETEEERYPG